MQQLNHKEEIQETSRINTHDNIPNRLFTHLVIGYLGEVGSAIYNILLKGQNNTVEGLDIDRSTFTNNIPFGFIHVCIPYQKTHFIEIVADYIEQYAQKDTIVIIHSTVEPGTTNSLATIHDRMVYSPVRGRHEDGLEKGLKSYVKFFMTENESIIPDVACMFNTMRMFVRGIHGDPTTLEFAKILNTTWFFAQVVFAQEIIRLADKHNLSSSIIKEFIDSTGDRSALPYARTVGNKDYDHCLIPNAYLLGRFSKFPFFLLDLNHAFEKIFGKEKQFL